MKKKITNNILFYLILFFNTNLLCKENKKHLKLVLLAPLSGVYQELGNSFYILYN